MTTTETKRAAPPRKTTEAQLNPEDWRPVAAWLKKHDVLRAPRAMLVNPEATAGLSQMLRKAARAGEGEELTIRLRHEQMEALAEQMRFWSSCQDELRRELRRDMPNWMYFHCLAAAIGGAIQEAGMENEKRAQGTPAPRTGARRGAQPEKSPGRAPGA